MGSVSTHAWPPGSVAAGALLPGGLLPTVWLSYHSFGLTAVALAGDVLVMGGLAVAVVTRGLPRALLDVYDSIPFPPSYHHLAWLQAGVSVLFVAVLLGCCAMTYYFVEAPMQRLGRRVAARLDARFGPDRPDAAGAPAS